MFDLFILTFSISIVLFAVFPIMGLVWTWVKIKLTEITERMG